MPDPTLTEAHVDALMDIAGWEHEEALTKLVEQIVAERVTAALAPVRHYVEHDLHHQTAGRVHEDLTAILGDAASSDDGLVSSTRGHRDAERPGDGDSEPLTAHSGATDKALRDVEQRIAQYAKHYPTDIWPDFGPDDDVRKDRAAAYMARHLLGRVIPAIFSDYRQEQGR